MNFTQATQRLNISQPPLSKHIKELESQPGVELFKRTARTMALAGRTLFHNVEMLLNQAGNALNQVQQLGRGEAGHMVIGIVGTSVWGGLIPALKCFTRQAETPSQQIISLQKRHIDIGVWREAKQQALPGLACQLLASEKISVVLLPIDHPLAKGPRLRYRPYSMTNLSCCRPTKPAWDCIWTTYACNTTLHPILLIRSMNNKRC